MKKNEFASALKPCEGRSARAWGFPALVLGGSPVGGGGGGVGGGDGVSVSTWEGCPIEPPPSVGQGKCERERSERSDDAFLLNGNSVKRGNRSSLLLKRTYVKKKKTDLAHVDWD